MDDSGRGTVTKAGKSVYIETDTLDSPIGPLLLAGTETGLCAIEFGSGPEAVRKLEQWTDRWIPGGTVVPSPGGLREIREQLEEYFSGQRRSFDLAFDLRGTEFQLRVWKALLSVPYGATASYKDIAAAIGSPQAVRAVGGANNRNPVPIVIPCHRIIGAGGQLVGYGGGLPVKTALLELEGWSPADVRHTSKNREWKA
ncbi:methylated-DNA--[protein]-cysteine S-methyltransferase [Paenibacillus chitinolyticus]|uniref:methylated-DNA--[protein]-cysteine S-methyltransferase n=1 Tax=Paenibacillus chitinolyticus TaxID=79263 RepID=UPI002DBA8461|nr:methylated-DNA--[protein]-cysteine S-methyltransferase [Paenibacillus chitinolyticus]MEC0248822.1 methylated-DNA--[protein]-cysteine S-methyltransferase [Paenibacillus chitinolyticus]